LVLLLGCTFDYGSLQGGVLDSGPGPDAGLSADAGPVDIRPDRLTPVDWSALVDIAPPVDLRPANLCPGGVGTYAFGAACPQSAAGYPCNVERYDGGGLVGAPCFRDVPGTPKAWYVSDCSQCAGVSL
jgi:hypothetical protein